MNRDRDEERKAGKAWHLGTSVVALIFGIFWCLVALSISMPACCPSTVVLRPTSGLSSMAME